MNNPPGDRSPRVKESGDPAGSFGAGRSAGGRLAIGSLLLAILPLIGSCGTDETVIEFRTGTLPATTSPVTTSAVITSPVTTGSAVNDLSGFSRADVVVAGEPFTVAVADTPVLRSQGLMGVTDLVDVDGMLFVFESEVEAVFWMKDTLIPLDIWFFDSDGKLVDGFTMTPCEADPCRTYPPYRPYLYALETEVGRVDPTATVELELLGLDG